MKKLILELIITILCLPGLTSAACYYYYYSYYCYSYYYYSYSSVGTYVGAAVGGIVFLIVVAVAVVCICAAKNNQRNRVVTMQGGGATVTNAHNVNTIQHPPPPAGFGYGAPPPPGYGPGLGPGYSQPSQSMFGDPAYPPNQYPPPKILIKICSYKEFHLMSTHLYKTLGFYFIIYNLNKPCVFLITELYIAWLITKFVKGSGMVQRSCLEFAYGIYPINCLIDEKKFRNFGL